MEMNIFIEMSKHLNLSWKINELENEVDKNGQLIKGQWVGDLVGALTNGTAEVGFSTIWESPSHLSHLDFTNSWMTVRKCILINKELILR